MFSTTSAWMRCENHFKNNKCYSYHFYYRLGYAEDSGTVITQFLSNSMQLYSSEPQGMLEACQLIKEEEKAPKLLLKCAVRAACIASTSLWRLWLLFFFWFEGRSSELFLLNTYFIRFDCVGQAHGEAASLATACGEMGEKVELWCQFAGHFSLNFDI